MDNQIFNGNDNIRNEIEAFKKNIKSFAEEKQLEEWRISETFFSIAWFRDFDSRYANTPPEFFPFANSGCDGEHYGLIYHYSYDEKPLIGTFCPMDDSISLLGRTFKEAIENLIVFNINNDIVDEENMLLLKEFCNKYKFDIKDEETDFMFKTNEIPMDGNLRFVPTSDGIGVYAPSKMFTEEIHEINDKYDTNYMFSQAEKYSKLGYHASSLYYLKELLFHNWIEDDLVVKMFTCIASEYEKLEKVHLKDVALKMLEKIKSDIKK